MYESNSRNAYFDDLSFYGDQSLINGWWIYSVNDDIVEWSNNVLIVDVYTYKCKKNKRLVQGIDLMTTRKIHVITEWSKLST